ncbi:leucine-rich repeat-containing protein 56 isoform X3 [Oryzias melastigma]|uniref:leucine-rich repeat-containing protein 56 isoform X3 n=1 Tax=Oryzias melastigma TaxID=30732 RepID=UPI000CF7B6D8|nr:leucine-rich repeat-containing protein 56 isoform X3 [Oryzias melastigma]
MSASGGCRERAVREVRSGTSGVLQLDAGHSPSIEPARRQVLLCGTGDLCHVTSLELCVDTQQNLLENVGASLPRLRELRLNNSKITSVRDLGSNFCNLEMLWMSRCGLQDLDGISSFPSLKELHVAFNCLSDLLHVSFLKKLQLLDLEGNEVDNLVDVQCLSSCVKLQTLTLRGNPVCIRPDATCPQVADYSYRASVQELLPQVRYLDNVKVEDRMTTEISDVPGNEFRSSNEGDNVGGAYHHSSGDSSPSSSAVTPSGGSQPSNRSSYGFSESRPAAEHLDSSILLHRSNSVLFCGNPVKAVRANRERLGSAPTRSMLHLDIHQPEDTLDSADVLSELRAWRVQHSRRLQAIQKGRSPQTLKYEEGADIDWSSQNPDAAHSSDRCSSPDLRQRDTSPAPKAPAGVRVRRLRPIQATSEHLSPINREVQTMAGLQCVHRPHPPPIRRANSGETLDTSVVQSNKMSNIFRRPAMSRPHTAPVLLQTPPQKHQLQSCRGSLKSQ